MTDVSALVLNRLSVVLRCLQELQAEGTPCVSSTALADRYQLSAAQIRKDLARFGEFGIRGLGYEVEPLIARLRHILGLDRTHRIVIVGIGSLGTALARYPGFQRDGFRIAGLFDHDPRKVGRRIGRLEILHPDRLATLVAASGAQLGILTVPADAAQSNYEALAAAGIRAVLNFAPVQLVADPKVRVKTVDLRIHLEELSFFVKTGA